MELKEEYKYLEPPMGSGIFPIAKLYYEHPEYFKISKDNKDNKEIMGYFGIESLRLFNDVMKES